MSITPSGFGAPGGAEDNPDYLTSTSPATGSEGTAEEFDKLGGDVEGIERRVVADETTTAAIVTASALGTANNPVQSATASRPTGLPVVYWYCATQPTNWINGDVWDNTQTPATGAALAADCGAGGTSDDTSTVQAAFSSGASVVQFRQGCTYTISSDLIVSAGQTIIAYGALIKAKGGTRPNLLHIKGTSTALITGVSVFGGTWDGNNTLTAFIVPYITGAAIRVAWADQIVIQDAIVQNCQTSGILAGEDPASGPSLVRNLRITGCTARYNVDSGICLRPGAVKCLVDQCTAYGHLFNGFSGVRADFATWSNCNAWGNGPASTTEGSGFSLEGCRWSQLTNCVASGNNNGNFHVQSTFEGGSNYTWGGVWADSYGTVQTSSGVISSTSGTTVIVTSGQAPSFTVGQYIVISTEVMKVTAINTSTHTLTVTRAQLGTAAISSIASTNVIGSIGSFAFPPNYAIQYHGVSWYTPGGSNVGSVPSETGAPTWYLSAFDGNGGGSQRYSQSIKMSRCTSNYGIPQAHNGVYASGTTYSISQSVEWQGAVYVYVNATAAAGNLPSNATYWLGPLFNSSVNANGGFQILDTNDVELDGCTSEGDFFGFLFGTQGTNPTLSNVKMVGCKALSSYTNGIACTLSAASGASGYFDILECVVNNAATIQGGGFDGIYTTYSMNITGGSITGTNNANGINISAVGNYYIQGVELYDNGGNGVIVGGVACTVLIADCVANNIAGTSQGRLVYENFTNSTTILRRNFVRNMNTEPWHLDSTTSFADGTNDTGGTVEAPLAGSTSFGITAVASFSSGTAANMATAVATGWNLVNVMLLGTVTHAGTFTAAIGSTSSTTETLYSAIAVVAGQTVTVLIPQGWFFKETLASSATATWVAQAM